MYSIKFTRMDSMAWTQWIFHGVHCQKRDIHANKVNWTYRFPVNQRKVLLMIRSKNSCQWCTWLSVLCKLQLLKDRQNYCIIIVVFFFTLLSFQKVCRIRKFFFFFFSVCCPSVMSYKPLFEWSQLQLSCKFTAVDI